MLSSVESSGNETQGKAPGKRLVGPRTYPRQYPSFFLLLPALLNFLFHKFNKHLCHVLSLLGAYRLELVFQVVRYVSKVYCWHNTSVSFITCSVNTE